LFFALFLQLAVFYNQGIKHRTNSKNQTLSQLDFSQLQQSLICNLGQDKLSNFPDLVWWHTKWQCKYSPYADEDLISVHYRLGSNRNQTLIWFESKTRMSLMRSDLDWICDKSKKPCFEGQGFKIIELDSIAY
jgi:hypothetical protein